MGVDRVTLAAEQLRGSGTVAELIGATARAFVEVLDAPACTISRVIGDLLVALVQHRRACRASRLRASSVRTRFHRWQTPKRSCKGSRGARGRSTPAWR